MAFVPVCKACFVYSYMVFHVHMPQAPLSHYVRDIFYYESDTAPYEAEKLLPDNTVYLIINFTDDPKKLYTDTSLTTYQTYKKAWLSGMQRRYIVIESSRDNKMMVIRFWPGKAYPFVGMPLTSFSEIVLESDDVFGGNIIAMREQLWQLTSAEEKCRQAACFLEAMIKKQSGLPPVIDFLVQELSLPEIKPIQELIKQTGYSHKHVLTLFERYVGMTPKHFARVAKFQQVLAAIEQKRNFAWSSLAYEYGFYDQSHFINEFKYFSGINPEQYMVEKIDTYNYLPVNYVKQ